ncbi:CRP/FNR family transcriptional regulator [Mobilisporobacter senegalensis]|uniref:CRP/FNR family transcriptional regulator n=1 Tax=Mobilisporobacter senegalensis TaxID=1329262 RepID=A0A3N1XR04_9FIRM|nr:Crp/Fnr family transcriptional regulator [Mobilisporobacter senegalensis]ROR27217.1 CRP/FNR family transcriptional regulator [Mobilisporobacter senegalensis]
MIECGHGCNHCSDQLCLHKVPIFNALDESDLEKIASIIIHREYKKGETIIMEGEKSESVVIMHEGSSKAYKYTPEGREQILYVFSEGDFFGETNLLRNQLATFSVEALQPVKTCMIMKSQFQSLIQQYPIMGIKIIEDLGDRMVRLENALQSMGVRNVDARISGLLLDFANKYGSNDKKGTVVHLPLSREGMANYLGIARETVSRKLGQLENDGIIQTLNNKSILIKDDESLKVIAGELY